MDAAVIDSSNYTTLVNLSQQIFRAYDIRGIVGDQLDDNTYYTLGLSLGTLLQKQQRSEVIVAYDGRISSPSFCKALQQGLMDTGVDVTDIGMVPTPVLYFATHHLPIDSGLMITGSHNPSQYNGLKMVIGGHTLAEQDIQDLYTLCQGQDFMKGQGKCTRQPMIETYIETIAQDIHLQRKLSVVIDCGNGVAGVLARQLFERIGAEVDAIHSEVDGRFPNHHPDPTVIKNLQDLMARVKHTDADLGIAFDGDGDRLGLVTSEGDVIWPDRQMILYAKDVLARNPNAKIVYDVKCSSHLKAEIEAAGGQAIMCPTGHSLVKAKMKQQGALLAGEMSGHIFFKERWFGFDDGLYTACRLLEIVAAQSQSLQQICQQIPDSINTPELKIAMADEKKFQFMRDFANQARFEGGSLIDIDGVRVEFESGWGLVRASNTTPCLVARFEARDKASLQRIQDQFRRELQAVEVNIELPF